MTQDDIKSILNYDSLTGLFTWKINKGRVKKGTEIKYINNNYKYVGINYKTYALHRLAWLYVYGYFPKEIDHINGNKSDNRIDNLRECTRQQNCQNRIDTKNKSSFIRNVHWHKLAKKWQVRVQIKNKRLCLGLFDDLELAELVAEEARNKYHKDFAYGS